MRLKDFIKTSYLKPWDLIIIVCLILVSFLPLVVFGMQQREAPATVTAVLKVDGQVIKTFDLDEQEAAYTYRYEADDGDYNLIEVDGEQIRIKEANCGDQVCVRRGWISKSGETIVCLPHKLVVEINASDGSESGSVIY